MSGVPDTDTAANSIPWGNCLTIDVISELLETLRVGVPVEFVFVVIDNIVFVVDNIFVVIDNIVVSGIVVVIIIGGVVVVFVISRVVVVVTATLAVITSDGRHRIGRSVSHREGNRAVLAPGCDRPVLGLSLIGEVPLSGDGDRLTGRHIKWLKLSSAVAKGPDVSLAGGVDAVDILALPFLLAFVSHATIIPGVSSDMDCLCHIGGESQGVTSALSATPGVASWVLSLRVVIEVEVGIGRPSTDVVTDVGLAALVPVVIEVHEEDTVVSGGLASFTSESSSPER